MTMPFSRYSVIRERLIELYNILNNRSYPVWIAPRTMMSIDELRDRFDYQQNGFANDHGFYDTQQLRQMRIPQILDVMENLTSVSDLGFGNSNKTVIEIYESIQEYIRLWCEIINSNTGFRSPPRTELRLLESLAYVLYPVYRVAKPFVVHQFRNEKFKEDRSLNNKGLAGFAVLLSMPGMQGPQENNDLSFVSYLDQLEGPVGGYVSVDQPTGPTYLTGNRLADSIAKIDRNDEDNTWIFRG